MENTENALIENQEEVEDEVKKRYRPDWLDNENKIFINRLNRVCDTYEQTLKDVKSLKE